MTYRFVMVVLAWMFAACACGGGRKAAEYPPVADDSREVDVVANESEDISGDIAAAEAATHLPASVVAVAHTPLGDTKPVLTIASPRAKLYRKDIELKLDLSGWELAPAPGQHVHLIVDDRPYIALRDISKPRDLLKLIEETTGKPLEPGSHILRAFPSRAHHESVKTDGAFAVVVFHYKKRTPGFAFNPRAPFLTYSRPKGCAKAGQALMLDFYVSNCDLGTEKDDCAVELAFHNAVDASSEELPDVQKTLTGWQPHHFENLQPGTLDIELTLMRDGKKLEGAYTSAARSIEVKESCQ